MGTKKIVSGIPNALCAGLLCLGAGGAYARSAPETRLNGFGVPGLIEMPGAGMRPDGELSFSLSYYENVLRNTLTFQIMPRLTGSFRYSTIGNFTGSGSLRGNGTGTQFDRSFSLQYLLMEEGATRPAVSVGLNDFLGTGIYQSEYLVASKNLNSRLRVTGGIGWGRLGTLNGFSNPLGALSSSLNTRGSIDFGQGGVVDFGNAFSGNVAFFGGLEYQISDKLAATLEYSSDAQTDERQNTFTYRSPINVGLHYRVNPNVGLDVRYMHGAELGVQLSFYMDPSHPNNGSGRETRPPPVVARQFNAQQLGWDGIASHTASASRETIAQGLEGVGVELLYLTEKGTKLTIAIENTSYSQDAQAIGRTARLLTRLAGSRIEVFEVTLLKTGLPVSATLINRRDLEMLEFEFNNTATLLANTTIKEANLPVGYQSETPSEFSLNFDPYLTPSLFDPDNPFRADAGIAAVLDYRPLSNLKISGRVHGKILGNLNTSTRPSTSVLPRVRSEFNLYDRTARVTLQDLTASYFFKPSSDIYGRFTVGYMERMYAGVSSEVLWKPVNSDLALGMELNYVRRRAFDDQFGLQPYGVATGHVSAYYDMGNGYLAQVDAGRYLAGDWGASFGLYRRFKNGWNVGAYAAFTNVSFDDFGEGSFDKGVTVEIPIDWLSGKSDRRKLKTTFQPVLRDGGARIKVNDRLYETIIDGHQRGIVESWGRVWR